METQHGKNQTLNDESAPLTRRQKRAERVERIQKRLETLRDQKRETRQNFIVRMILLVLSLPIFLLLCLLAFGLREASIARMAFNLLKFTAVQGWKASEENSQADAELTSARDDARTLGLEAQGLSIVEPSSRNAGAVSLTSEDTH